MYRLLSDAKELDETFDADFSLSSKGTLQAEFADILEAIHIVQTEMGITGTTAKEADSTISGSLASVKGSWENLLVGFADPDQDMGQLTSNFIGSVTTAAGNLIPRISEMIPGIVDGIKKMAPLVNQAFDEHLVPLVSEGLSGAFSLIGIEIDPETIGGVFAKVKDTVIEKLSGVKEFISENKDEFVGLGGAFGKLGEEAARLVDQVDWDAVFSGLLKGVKAVTEALGDAVGGMNNFIDKVKELSDEHGVVGGFFKALADETNPNNKVPTLEELGVESEVNLDDLVSGYIANNTPFQKPIEGPSITFGDVTAKVRAVRADIEAELGGGTVPGPEIDFGDASAGASAVRSSIESTIGQPITVPILYEVTGDPTALQANASAKIDAAKKAEETAVKAQTDANYAAKYGDETAARSAQAVADARAEAAAKKAAEAAAAIMQANREAITSKNTKKNAEGAILNRATIFGKVGETYQIGGEAGAEAIAPIDKLQAYVSTAVAEVMAGQNAATAEVFAASAGAIVDKLETLADDIAEAIGGTRIGINKRGFGRLVREV